MTAIIITAIIVFGVCGTFLAMIGMGLHHQNKKADRAIKESFSHFLDKKVNSTMKK